jgi:hypothetical protein
MHWIKFSLLAFAAFASSCAVTDEQVGQRSVISAAPDAAIVLPAVPPDRRESFYLLYAGQCVEPALGKKYLKVLSERIFTTPDRTELRVSPDVPVTFQYSFYISDKSCSVAASTVLKAKTRYVLSGERVYSGGLLPVSTGCRIHLVEESTKAPVVLFPPTTGAAAKMCQER